MTEQWTIQIPVFITISGEQSQMTKDTEKILNTLKTQIESIIFESGTASARLEDCLGGEITLHEMDVTDASINCATSY